jgi:hypothetical protein
MPKLTIPFEEVTDEELKLLLASCPHSWQGDQGFQNWCKALLDLAGGSTPAAAPTITSLTPDTGLANADITVAISGTGFDAGATVDVAGTTLSPELGATATALSVLIPSAVISSAGSVQVAVQNPDAQWSNALPFTVT